MKRIQIRAQTFQKPQQISSIALQASPLYSFLPHTPKSSGSQVPVSSDLSPSTVHHLWSTRRQLTCRLSSELISITDRLLVQKEDLRKHLLYAPASCCKWQPSLITNKSRLQSIPVQFPLRHIMREIRSSHIKLTRTHLRLITQHFCIQLIYSVEIATKLVQSHRTHVLQIVRAPPPHLPTQFFFFSILWGSWTSKRSSAKCFCTKFR